VSAGEIRVAINSSQDIVVARQRGRMLAAELGFSAVDCTFLATAISELARNIVAYAGQGEIALRAIREAYRQGIIVIASDNGPGIRDVQQALRDGFSTSGSLGLGLPGVRRLMDEFEIKTRPGRGTVVTVKKWKQ
jgi:serine/threonine-protein kinase RsbT